MDNTFSEPQADHASISPLQRHEILEMLPSYVLGALELDEMLAVDEYIQQNRTLLLQLDQLEETAAQLVFAAPQVRPPDGVKSQLIERLYTEKMGKSAPFAADGVDSSRAEPQPAQPGLQTNRQSTPATRPRTWQDSLRQQMGDTSVWPVLTAVAITAALLLLLYSGQIQSRISIVDGQLESLQQEMLVLRAEKEQLQVDNLTLQQRLHERENQLALFANATRVITLEGTEEAPGASGSFYAGQPFSVLVLRGLAPLPEDQVHQLWLIPEQGDPVSVGLVQVDETGMATTMIPMQKHSKGFAAVGLSVEPASGSEHPSGPIVLLGTVKP